MRLILAALVLAAAACAARPQSAWQPEQAEAVAWWIEDVAHGRVRDPAELQFEGAGQGPDEIARWAAGNRIGGRWEPPARLAARTARWGQIAAALATGEAVPAGDSGLLAPAPGVPPERRAAVAELVDAENDDRRFLALVVQGLGHPDPGVRRAYEAASRDARSALDRAAGQPPAKPAAR